MDTNTPAPTEAPFGSWRSPISAAHVARGATPLSAPDAGADGSVYWVEGRPLEGGRYVLVRHAPDGMTADVTPPGFNVRTRAHEYGGGAYLVRGETVFFANFADQRLYRQDDAGEPRPITAEPDLRAGVRFADMQATPDGRWLIAVRETHTEGREAVNDLVALPADGSAPPRAIASGHDFYSSPAISPDGRQLAWLTWDHPRMPWDGTELWLADLAADATPSDVRKVAGGPDESLYLPAWSPTGQLHVVSDRSGWWNLYVVAGDALQPLAPMDAEFGVPQWVFGTSTYSFLADGRIVCVYSQAGLDHMGVIEPGSNRVRDLGLPYTHIAPRLRTDGRRVVFVASAPTEASAVIRLGADSGVREVLRTSVAEAVEPAYLSAQRPIEFPTESGLTAFALYYPPTNPDFRGPAGQRPPLIVESHGGPTSAARAQLDLETQFWTSRGFGVVDVNYGGSSGYGRAYRQRLNRSWGIVDVQDCINAAKYLAAQGEVDGQRLAIRGGSAGGYTTLCALTFHDDFAAGASYYGIADCEALATDTHKFESRYLDGLIGPYPAARDVYRARSPIHYTDRLSCPVILFQGLEDKVVPPAQAEAMARALDAKGLPYAYLAFAGEQHGFRKAETMQRTLEAELYFYSRVFRFPLADPIEPVEVKNL